MNDLLINTTSDDIEKGIKGASQYCVLALACRRDLPFSPTVELNVSTKGNVYDSSKGLNSKWLLLGSIVTEEGTSQKVKRYIGDYDNGKQVVPATFKFVPTHKGRELLNDA